ncbi:MAG: RecX family transcriptional regulator [Acidobacteria bacterium]|nr:RecX family transcriptional regulator [Acidobacteriota bacterium]
MSFARQRKLATESELYEYAVNALARRMRTIAELKRMLRRRVDAESEIGQTLVELVTRRLKDQGYLSDLKYAALYSALRRDNEKFGRRRVISDLKAKGVHGEVLDKAVESAFAEVDDQKQAREYLRRKRIERPRNQKQAARVFRQLVRAGFRSSTVFQILRKWDLDEEFLLALEQDLPESID